MNKLQLEMSFDASTSFSPRLRVRQRRQSRAQWWFAQMRRVVDQALDWKPAPPARPEQSYLRLAEGR
jgi:hypothetical protein